MHHAWTVLDSVEVDFMFTHYLLGCGTDETTKQQVPLFSGNLSLFASSSSSNVSLLWHGSRMVMGTSSVPRVASFSSPMSSEDESARSCEISQTIKST